MHAIGDEVGVERDLDTEPRVADRPARRTSADPRIRTRRPTP
ncbi:hypothetical protein ACFWAR_10985 [Streptomyces sp. NPDC059917]